MKFLIIATVLLIALLLASCDNRKAVPPLPPESPSAAPVATAAAQPRAITPAEAKQRLDNEPGIVLLDVREPDEYAEGHIKGSVLLPLGDIEAKAAETLPDKDVVIFVYCRSGRRSAIAASMLAGFGYTEVYDLGGIMDWPYEVER